MKCGHCGAEFEGRFCPECGARAEAPSPVMPPSSLYPATEQQTQIPPVTGQATYQKPKKPKKPIYKKWWFYVVAAVVLFAIINSVSGGSKSVKIKWDEMVLGSYLPEPPASRGEIHENSADMLSVDIKKISAQQYSDYTEACKSKGFTVDAESDSYSYTAFNAEGYKLTLRHYSSDKELKIEVEKPIEMSTITWPAGQAGEQLPVPKSTTGRFSYEYDDHFQVYIGNTSREDYNDYVEACADKGFTVDYHKDDNYYRADNSDGWSLALEYKGNNVMSIRISEPSKGANDSTPETTTETATSDTAEPSEPESSETETDTVELVDGMRKDFKDAMDSYETFMDGYVAFMKKYNDNPNDPSLLVDYLDYMSKYADVVDKFDKWESEDLNNTELAYYIDVQARVSKNLLEVAG